MSAVVGSRRWSRGALCALALAACALFSTASGASAAAVAPIIGKWQSSGAVVNVTATGPGTFQGKIVSGTFGACPGVGGNGPGGMIWNNMTGSGFSYSGTIPWVLLPDCTPLGEGKTTFKLTSGNSGSLTSTSPDGSKTETASMTRVGAAPGAGSGGKPKTNCQKNGKPVLCPKQKTLSKNVASLAKKQAKLGKQLKKATKSGSEEKAIDLAAKMNDKILQAQNKNKKLVPEGNLKTFEDLWKLFKLPQKEKGAQAKKMAGDQAKQFLFGDQADKTLSLNNQLVQTADAQYKSNPAIAAELDTAADYALTGVRYDQLPESDRLKAAARIESTLGTQFNFTNSAADLGIKGLKFTLTTKGAKL